jgi:tol-pal system protein YbgF
MLRDGLLRGPGVALLLSAAVVGCQSLPADQDPVQIKLNDVDGRLGRVESVVNNQSLLELSRRIDALEAQQRQLRGSIEESQNGGEQQRKQQRDLYADLDRRIAALEQGQKQVQNDAGIANAAAPDTGDDQSAYNKALESLKTGEYSAAITQLRELMSRFPDSALLDNAQYWTGEAYYVMREYDQAATAFRAVGERWPASRKAPDALLKLGYTQFEQKKLAEARATLRQVQQRFPGSEAAKLAGERLAKLPAEAR